MADLSNLASHRVTLGHFFGTMHAGCPRMAILPSNADLPHLNVIYGPISICADLHPGDAYALGPPAGRVVRRARLRPSRPNLHQPPIAPENST